MVVIGKKSPWAALLWSLTMAGFGQLYNRDYIIAFALLGSEIIVNFNANLNLSVVYTFHAEFLKSHDVVNYQWALFYPSIWGFGMWQAYNRTRETNSDSKTKKTGLTGLLFGLVSGMNIGLILHVQALEEEMPIFMSPVINGLTLGVTGALLGHQVAKYIQRHHAANNN
jgi:hypothetical protein